MAGRGAGNVQELVGGLLMNVLLQGGGGAAGTGPAGSRSVTQDTQPASDDSLLLHCGPHRLEEEQQLDETLLDESSRDVCASVYDQDDFPDELLPSPMTLCDHCGECKACLGSPWRSRSRSRTPSTNRPDACGASDAGEATEASGLAEDNSAPKDTGESEGTEPCTRAPEGTESESATAVADTLAASVACDASLSAVVLPATEPTEPLQPQHDQHDPHWEAVCAFSAPVLKRCLFTMFGACSSGSKECLALRLWSLAEMGGSGHDWESVIAQCESIKNSKGKGEGKNKSKPTIGDPF